ncbi:hypothetical protein EYF80_048773 [Liparis tanakae]|uniref:Uncharacterized protein n=1 Tax=Liparis tanakae TaxID=230148 RepID=A0A4Z2FLB4_9TELE|nr:hypothetical protein EYF80_048773 [Liparis tanakae]
MKGDGEMRDEGEDKLRGYELPTPPGTTFHDGGEETDGRRTPDRAKHDGRRSFDAMPRGTGERQRMGKGKGAGL